MASVHDTLSTVPSCPSLSEVIFPAPHDSQVISVVRTEKPKLGELKYTLPKYLDKEGMGEAEPRIQVVVFLVPAAVSSVTCRRMQTCPTPWRGARALTREGCCVSFLSLYRLSPTYTYMKC